MNSTQQVVFFDIGETLGSALISPPPHRLIGLDVYPYTPALLQRLRNDDVRIGIISDTGDDGTAAVNQVLDRSNLLSRFDPNLLIYTKEVGLKKNSPEIFGFAVGRAEVQPELCLFVGEDSLERRHAAGAGMRVCPHPLLAWAVLHGERLRYVRITVPAHQAESDWRTRLKNLDAEDAKDPFRSVVPLHVSGERAEVLYAIATRRASLALADLQLGVQLLGKEDAPLFTDLYLLRDDRAARSGFLSSEGQSARFFGAEEEADWLLSSSPEGLLVALPAGRSIEQYHFEEAYHGHNQKLLPDPNLLEPFGEGAGTRTPGWLAAAAAEPELSDAEFAALREIAGDAIRRCLRRYTGAEPLGGDADGAITSRHIHSPGNARATEALARDLQEIGPDLAVRLHQFTHEGLKLYNVEAELPGDGTDEVVLVTAHLDSTAAFSPPYDAATDPAPGADDDASGVAAVLVIAQTFYRLAAGTRPRRRLRFVLFNAEEHGLIGSKAYARNQAAVSAPIVAVYQMDMIGYNRAAPRSWEVHAGYWPSAEVQERSLVLAERLRRFAAQVSPELDSPQIYSSAGPSLEQRDPAEGRSDHASFQERGYAACTASEDFFAGPRADSPSPENNPEYHKGTDTFVDDAYAADIARTIAAAAWASAKA